MKQKTCCFTGHRRLSQSESIRVVSGLSREIDRLLSLGVTDFISGGALGFDQMAAAMVISKRAARCGIRLIFALPCPEYDLHWDDDQQYWMEKLLEEADEIVYVSDAYSDDCMKKRNYYMVDRSAYCMCALLRLSSGTDQTVRYAAYKGLDIINVCESNT